MIGDRPALETDEIDITPEMIEAGLVWLYAYEHDRSLEHDHETVIGIIKSALATLSRPVWRGV